MLKKVLGLVITSVMLLGLFGLTACGGDKVNKIDIGSEIVAGKPMSTMVVRIMLDKDIFYRDDEIKVKLGFGFRNEQPVPSFVEVGAVVVFKIEAIGFIIASEIEVKSNNGYEKEFAEYSDSKFVCTLDNKRYIPNYYEMFGIEFISDLHEGSGTITISATLDYRNGNYDGKNERLYYFASSDKIAFSTVSVADAQKKLR